VRLRFDCWTRAPAVEFQCQVSLSLAIEINRLQAKCKLNLGAPIIL
jgi:hypothetical protein